MQTSVVVDQNHVKVAWVVSGAAEHIPDSLCLLVLVRFETEHSDILGGEQNRLPAPGRCPVVLCCLVHVSLRQVVQLRYGSVGDNVALLFRCSVKDAQSSNDRLLQNVCCTATAKDAKVGRAAQLAEYFKIMLSVTGLTTSRNWGRYSTFCWAPTF